jgi:hypothetical protein
MESRTNCCGHLCLAYHLIHPLLNLKQVPVHVTIPNIVRVKGLEAVISLGQVLPLWDQLVKSLEGVLHFCKLVLPQPNVQYLFDLSLLLDQAFDVVFDRR